MNLPETLARRILAVAKARKYYEEIGELGKLALVPMDEQLERACLAAGSGDIMDIMKALKSLEGYEE